MSDLTIFVATFNRLDTLENCIESLERQTRPKQIVIVDNGSTWDKAVVYLNFLETKYTVYRMPRIEDVPREIGDENAHGGDAMQAVQRNVSEAFRQERWRSDKDKWYGMTDADVWLDGPSDSLDTYIRLAEQTGRAVGPHLRLSAHRNYPLRSAAIIQHARILFRDRMFWWNEIPHSVDPIDTTFHLFPAGDWFNRLGMETFRVGPPYMATHSDWLIDFCNPTEENYAYILRCGEAASWGGRWIKGFFEAWLRSPEEAFALVEADRMTRDDYFYPGFMLSWMLEFGHGCEIDLERSKRVLRRAFPTWSPCLQYKQHWDALLAGDESCLGWE